MDRSNVALLAGVLVTVTIVSASFAWAFSTWLPDSDPALAFFFGYSVMLTAVLVGIGIRSWIDRY